MRFDDSEIRNKLVRQILSADQEELALMAENLLGVKVTYDHREFYPWDVQPNPETYCGAFDQEGLTATDQSVLDAIAVKELERTVQHIDSTLGPDPWMHQLLTQEEQKSVDAAENNANEPW